jgi:hypothetical protein
LSVFYVIPWWLLALLHGALLAAALLLGRRLGRARARAGEDASQRANSGLSTLTAALIGLVGLLLGFSFSMASSRYDQRQTAVVREANAIATTYLRADLLEPPVAARLRPLLKSYVEKRVALYDLGVIEGTGAAVEAKARTEELRREIWTAMAAETHRKELSEVGAILVMTTAINEMVDTSGERDAATEDRVPDGVLLLLVVTTVASCLLVGLASGQDGEPRVVPWIVFALSLVLVVGTIVDLDRPTGGLSRVGQAPMTRLLTEEMRGSPE